MERFSVLVSSNWFDLEADQLSMADPSLHILDEVRLNLDLSSLASQSLLLTSLTLTILVELAPGPGRGQITGKFIFWLAGSSWDGLFWKIERPSRGSIDWQWCFNFEAWGCALRRSWTLGSCWSFDGQLVLWHWVVVTLFLTSLLSARLRLRLGSRGRTTTRSGSRSWSRGRSWCWCWSRGWNRGGSWSWCWFRCRSWFWSRGWFGSWGWFLRSRYRCRGFSRFNFFF